VNRRGFLGGLLVALAAPVVIRTPGLLMPVKPLFGSHPGGVDLRPGVINYVSPSMDVIDMLAEQNEILRGLGWHVYAETNRITWRPLRNRNTLFEQAMRCPGPLPASKQSTTTV
jgi:hypothetical protein